MLTASEEMDRVMTMVKTISIRGMSKEVQEERVG